jgi:hypothetical protein
LAFRLGRLSSFGTGVLAVGVVLIYATAAPAQGFGPDPFRPYNSQYDPFVFPVAPTPGDFGYGQGLPATSGIRNANQFSAYMNSLSGLGANRSGAGVPYFQANRAYDRQYDRLYQPNREADSRFESTQSNATNLYFQYLRERDPKKRMALFRDYNKARNKANRELASPRLMTPRSGVRPSAREAAPGTGASDDAPPVLDRSRPRGGDEGAPPLPGGARSRAGAAGAMDRAPGLDRAPSLFGRSRTSTGLRGRLPSDILNRAERSTPLRRSDRPAPRLDTDERDSETEKDKNP